MLLTSASDLMNCLVTFNHVNSLGGGAYSCTLSNCTIAGNMAGFGGSGSLGGVVSGSAKNCIMYTNAGVNVSSVFLRNCCTFPLSVVNSGNITNAPLFVNDNSDFHLQPNSPCINSGNNAYVTNSVDLDGSPRIAGNVVDMGAYEYQNPASVISYAWLQQFGLATDGSADYQDTDSNGMNNWQKWMAGLNPTNPASLLLMQSPTNAAGGGLLVVWQSVNTRTYFLQRSTNLNSGDFSVIQSNITGRTGTTGLIDRSATNAVPYFYRVGVQP